MTEEILTKTMEALGAKRTTARDTWSLQRLQCNCYTGTDYLPVDLHEVAKFVFECRFSLFEKGYTNFTVGYLEDHVMVVIGHIGKFSESAPFLDKTEVEAWARVVLAVGA